MFSRIFHFVGVSMLLVAPAVAQFGVPGKKKGSSFQELNEQAKQMQGGDGGLGDLDLKQLMGGFDPEMLEQMAGLGAQFGEAMKIMAEMSPEELKKQMEDTMNMFKSGEIVTNMMEQRDVILKTLEETGQVDPEELKRFKADPEYFEQKMKESFDQMGSLLSDPDVVKMATESFAGIQDVFNNPGKINEMMGEFFKEVDDDEKVEEARQMMLASPELSSIMFEGEDMKEVLNDPKKFRETVREGRGLLQNGAAVGEL